MRKLPIPAYGFPALLALLLAACQSAPVTTAGGSVAPSGNLPAQPAEGATRYEVDAERSEVRFLVYKAGAMSAFGHDHVIQARHIKGEVYLASKFEESSFSLTLPVTDFEVDNAEARGQEGPDFAKQPSASDIAGTRKNMLGPGTLDAEKYPDVRIQSVRVRGPEWQPEITVRITLHGTARDLTVPVSVAHQGDELSAGGAFDLRQSEFGIKPFSVFGGALQVADTLRVRFRIIARKNAQP